MMKPYQSPPLRRYDVTYTLVLSPAVAVSCPVSATTGTTLHLCKCSVCVGEGRAEGRVPGGSSLSEVRMSNAARPLHRISRHHRGKIQRKMLEGGRWGKQHIVSHTSMQMPPLRWDCNFCSSVDKNRFHYLELFSLTSAVWLRQNMY